MTLVTRLKARFSRPTRVAAYWETRYRDGGNSGAGSYGQLAAFKAEVLNRLVAENDWRTVLELGCGDGAQVELANYVSYLGVDVSATAVALCRARFSGRDDRRFIVSGKEPLELCDVALSLDVIYHLVDDALFERYMDDLTSHAAKGLVLYTSDSDVFTPPREEPAHIRHRPIQRWMAECRPEWHQTLHIPNPYPWREDDENTSFADFYVYERSPTSARL